MLIIVVPIYWVEEDNLETINTTQVRIKTMLILYTWNHRELQTDKALMGKDLI
jgi:hypothetical protein